MKRKQQEQTEKRRPAVEPNLVGGPKARSESSSRGCASLFGHALLLAMCLAISFVGLR